MSEKIKKGDIVRNFRHKMHFKSKHNFGCVIDVFGRINDFGDYRIRVRWFTFKKHHRKFTTIKAKHVIKILTNEQFEEMRL